MKASHQQSRPPRQTYRSKSNFHTHVEPKKIIKLNQELLSS